MDKKYVTLFKELARTTAVSAEQVMDYNRELKDKKGLETATIMRDDYQNLCDKITNASDGYIPTKADIAKLLVAAMIATNQISDRMEAFRKALTGYQTDVIPKLQSILDTSETDEDVAKSVEENFIIENKE